MKLPGRQFWGSVLIGIGVFILLAVICDSIQPYFPPAPPSSLLDKVSSFCRERFSPHPPPPGKPPSPPPSRTRRASPPPVLTPDGLLTPVVHHTGDQYHLWVWGIKPERKTGDRVKVEIAHGAAGEEGGFQIVAYADTDGDSQPDREIARSDFLIGGETGDWSSFEFRTGEEKIFVGNIWPEGKNTQVFRGNGPWPNRDCPFEDLFYHYIAPDKKVTAGPAYTNMKVSFPPSD